GRRSVKRGRGPRRRSRRHALRLRPRRLRQRLHGAVADPGLTGILLVGGTSSRFGSPKELAEYEGETLRDRAWRLLGEACDERLAVGAGGVGGPGTGAGAAVGARAGGPAPRVAGGVPRGN